MLEALGFLGERDLVAAIVEDVDEMVAEAARDLYMDGFKDADSPEFGFGAAEDIARDAMRNPAAELSPDESELADPGSPAAQAVLRRVRFTRKLRTIVERRKRPRGSAPTTICRPSSTGSCATGRRRAGMRAYP